MIRTLTFVCFIIFTVSEMPAQIPSSLLYRNERFSLYADRVVQGPYTGYTTDGRSLRSDYQSPINLEVNPKIYLKFSINGKDNELPGKYSMSFVYPDKAKKAVTPVHTWGQKSVDNKTYKHAIPPSSALTIRLDLKPVLKAIEKDGYYTCYNGTRIYKEDFHHVCVAGSVLPLNWDYDNLVNNPPAIMKDEDGDGIYTTELILNTALPQKQTAQSWSLKKDVSSFPAYRGPFPIIEACYNLALEEMLNAIEPDSTFRTGKEWAGVWTRDISYSIILSMAYMQPEVAKKSLMRKVSKRKTIIQDTGTGGAWPVSSDRMVWAIAAYEIYKATQDREWLEGSYRIIKNSLRDDLANIYDESTGLVKGESSFLDWRDQTYPKWMQPADIFESENLGTNAVHYQANIVLAEMAGILGYERVAQEHRAIAGKIKDGINQWLWIEEKGFYAQYLYGRDYKMLSPRAEALGEALCVIFDIADDSRSSLLTQKTPVTPFGITCIYPQIPDMPPYHNNGIWPFVQTYWLWAGAEAGNEASVMTSIASLYRPPALFATNKENFVADDGDFLGTVINSDNMLWSLAGNISIVHRILFGIQRQADGLHFSPFVPKALQGEHYLDNFRYLDARLRIRVSGWGNVVRTMKVNGMEQKELFIPTDAAGDYEIEIILDNRVTGASGIHMVDNYTTVQAPYVRLQDKALHWDPVDGAAGYAIFRNGMPLSEVKKPPFPVSADGSYQVEAIDGKSVHSFASEPVEVYSGGQTVLQAESFAIASKKPYKGYTGDGFVELSKLENLKLHMPFEIEEAGKYSIRAIYSNGNGPSNTENKCAIRTVLIDNRVTGTFVFPQRGRGEWSNWGATNAIIAGLSPGRHYLTIEYRPANENMNGRINEAMLDRVELVRIGD